MNLILYHGVLAPRAAWRAEVVGEADERVDAEEALRTEAEVLPAEPDDPSSEAATRSGRPGARLWAELMRRSFGVDVLACPRCGGRMRLIALIEAGAISQRILRHLGLPVEIPATRPARAPSLADVPDPSWADVVSSLDPCS
jgi:hypothetical protein